MKVFVIILNYNGKKDTLVCLQSLNKLDVSESVDLNILVIDNASKDDSVEMLKSEFPHVWVYKNKRNDGFAKGNNLGLQLARDKGGEMFILLNNDTEVDKEMLTDLLEAVEKHPKGGIFSPKIYFFPGREFHQERYLEIDRGKVIWFAGGEIDWQNVIGKNVGVDEVDKGQYDEEKMTELATGCCMLLTRSFLDEVGGFDERYFMYYEDADLCMRAKKNGWEIWYVPKAKVWHVNAGSSGSGSSLQDYFISRNRLLFGLKYAPWRSKLALIRQSVKLLRNGRLAQMKGVKDFYMGKFGKGSWPLLEHETMKS